MIEVWPTNSAMTERPNKGTATGGTDFGNARDGVAEEITRQQKQLEIEGEPGELRAVVSQRDQQGAAGGEPGGVIVGEKVVMTEPVGRLVPTSLVLNPGLKRLVVRALARSDDFSGRPVADEVGIDLLPWRGREQALDAERGQQRE